MQKKLGMLSIDMHVHTSGVSSCAKQTVEETIACKIKEGYDGMVLTNHCQSWYYAPSRVGHEKYIRSVLEEYARAVEYGKRRNFRVYLGLEVTLLNPFYADWLLYGVTEEFLKNSPPLYMLSQKELFEFCEKYGVLLVQAHPFRPVPYVERVYGVGEKEYLHGIEINCSEKDTIHKDRVVAIARENGLLITAGTDYHGKPERPFVVGGAYIPENVRTSEELAGYLKGNKDLSLFFGEEEIFVRNFS